MTTPAEYRAIAARVMAGEATNEEIGIALGWVQCAPSAGLWWRNPSDAGSDWVMGLPRFLTSLDAAAALFAPLRERGWEMQVTVAPGENVNATAVPPDEDADIDDVIDAAAPDERAARVALALLCLAAEGEATP